MICPYCGQLTQVVWVHGHGQCMVCKTIIDECCRGEQDASSGNDKDSKENNDICKIPNDIDKKDEKA